MVHPSSTNPVRPSSSLSVGRPSSSASLRSLSRLSHHRPTNARSQARSKLLPLAQALVKQVTGFDDNQDVDDVSAYHESVEFVIKNLEATTKNKGAARMDMNFIEQTIQGHALKARIALKEDLGKALETCMKDIHVHMKTRESDLDDEIQVSRIPDHIQLLLALSNAPTKATEAHASLYLHNRANPSAPPDRLTWASIVAEEPFEGEHWEGVYGLPAGFVKRPEPEDGKWFYDKEKERERIDFDSRWSTPSLSPLNSDDLELDEEQERELAEQGRMLYEPSIKDVVEEIDVEALERSRLEQQAMVEEDVGLKRHPPPDWTYRREFDELRQKQYWTENHQQLVLDKGSFKLGEPSSLGPSLDALGLSEDPNPGARDNGVWYIDEDDAVREVLMALQGRKNIMLEWKKTEKSAGYHIPTPMPRLRHLSAGSQTSLLASISRTATAVQHLRLFVDDIFRRASPSQNLDHGNDAGPSYQVLGKVSKNSQTVEAFADALHKEIIIFDKWCASREEAILRAWGGGGSLPGLLCNSSDRRDGLVVSLLSTEKAVQEHFLRTFQVFLSIVQNVLPRQIDSTGSFTYRHGSEVNFAAATGAYLLDELLWNAQTLGEQGEFDAKNALTRVFIHTAEPLWSMTMLWLRDGMVIHLTAGVNNNLQLAEEFFIENNGVGLGIVGMGLLDPEFWKEGYALRDEALFLETERSDSVKGGKQKQRNQKSLPRFLHPVAQSILRAGKAIGLLRAMGIDVTPPSVPVLDCTFRDLLVEEADSLGESSWSQISCEELSRAIYDVTSPRCDAADTLLTEILTGECAIWDHLQNIEDLLLMRRWDMVSHFADVLFMKIDSHQPWTDFHTLNTAFRDVIEANAISAEASSVQTSLIRLSYRGSSKQRADNLSVNILEGLVVEYAIPFPLTYVFQPAALQIHSEVFVFLLQARRAKGMLEKVLMKASSRQELFKPFYAMRSRLSWFINTFLNFLTTYVIQTLLSEFHEIFVKATSLDELEEIYTKHSEKIQLYCLLRPQEVPLRRTLLSIFDIALHFTDSFIGFAGSSTATHDLSTVSIKQHRSRRQRRHARNIIGLSASVRVESDSSEEDESENATEPSFSYGASVSYEDEDFHTRMERMSAELDGLLKFFRRGVENLAASPDSALFGILAFGLDDWDS